MAFKKSLDYVLHLLSLRHKQAHLQLSVNMLLYDGIIIIISFIRQLVCFDNKVANNYYVSSYNVNI
jgi:hypothetical protein